jgi:histidinol phosphatase-like enzyme (inositol monophosphatase family)
MSYSRELDAAISVARRAAGIALPYWEHGVAADLKDDKSPVTVADRECESFIAAAFEELFPEDGLLGEEGVAKHSRNGRRWIIDPIDGTRDFVRGNRMWATLLALEAGGEVVAGVCHFPALEETYSAFKDGGAYLNEKRIHVSATKSVSQAVLCINDFATLSRSPLAPRLLDWMVTFWAIRNMGGGPDAMLVASGKADAWLEPNAKPWDLAPIKIITTEAGGRFFNLNGEASIYGGNCVTCTPGLEGEMRRFISSNTQKQVIHSD